MVQQLCLPTKNCFVWDLKTMLKLKPEDILFPANQQLCSKLEISTGKVGCPPWRQKMFHPHHSRATAPPPAPPLLLTYEVPVSADGVNTGRVTPVQPTFHCVQPNLKNENTNSQESTCRYVPCGHTTTHLPRFTLGPEEKWGTACKQSLQLIL